MDCKGESRDILVICYDSNSLVMEHYANFVFPLLLKAVDFMYDQWLMEKKRMYTCN